MLASRMDFGSFMPFAERQGVDPSLLLLQCLEITSLWATPPPMILLTSKGWNAESTLSWLLEPVGIILRLSTILTAVVQFNHCASKLLL